MNNPPALPDATRADYNQQLGDEITLLAGQINAANYRLLKLIAEFDDREAWGGGGTVRSCAHWLNWQCGIALGAAREKVRVAQCLKNLPLIDAAFAAGEISFSKVRAMTRAATPENEDFMMVIARYSTASHLEKVVAKYQGVQRGIENSEEDSQEDKQEVTQEEARKLVYYQDDDGMWVIHAKLPAEAGSQLVKAIDAVATPVQVEKQRQILERAKQEEATADADADAENVSAETFSDAVQREDPDTYQDLLVHTRADALVTIAEHFLATCDQSPQGHDTVRGLMGNERCQIMLHVDINTLQQHSNPENAGQTHCNTDNKRWLSPKTARRLGCDATLVTVLEDTDGKVLNIGRRARTVPASIRRALTLRDETCRFPGCCTSKGVEAHHIQHWADGGETSLDNLVNLCRFHHKQLHRGCFSVSMEAPNTIHTEPQLVFSTPSGKHIEAVTFPQFPKKAAQTAKAALKQIAPQVNTTTCKSHWCGERVDYGAVIDALLRRDEKLLETERSLTPT